MNRPGRPLRKVEFMALNYGVRSSAGRARVVAQCAVASPPAPDLQPRGLEMRDRRRGSLARIARAKRVADDFERGVRPPDEERGGSEVRALKCLPIIAPQAPCRAKSGE